MEFSKVVIAAVILESVFTDGRACPRTPNALSNDTRTKPKGVVYDTVRYGHYIELDCCLSEREDLIPSWMKWNQTTEQWQEYHPDRVGVSFFDNKQTLSIQSSTFDDAGLYRCSVRNGTSVTEVKDFHLDVVACDKLARGPYPVSPLPCQEVIANVNETLTLPCTGYFGCGEEGDIRIATWFVSRDKNKQDNWVEVTSIDERYKQIEFQRDGGVVKGSNLTILNVSEVDFNRKFMCLLASPQMLHGQSRLFVTLKKANSNVFNPSLQFVRILLGVSILAVTSLVFNVVLSVITIYKRWQTTDDTV